MFYLKRTVVSLSLLTLFTACGGEPEWIAVYEDCKAQISAASEEMNKASEDANESPEMKAMMNSMGTMALNIGMSTCEMIRSTCENAPDGSTCQTIIEQSKNRQN